jgi:hypothetical protein
MPDARHGRSAVTAVRVAAACLALSAVAGCGGQDPAPERCRDAVQTRSLDDLADFTGWLEEHRVDGLVGEVGWPAGPDERRWRRVAEAWYDAADQADLPVTAWAASAWWPSDYPLALYRDGTRRLVPAAQAAVVERHRSRPGGVLRGVAEASGSFGTDQPGYSSQSPGTYGETWTYPSAAELRRLADRGHQLVRLAFTWERVQPRLRSPLDEMGLDRLRTAVTAAHAAGLQVLLDLHSYGRYRVAADDGSVRELVLGGRGLPGAALADVWRRLATAFRDVPGVWGYGLMNEPHDLGGPRGGARRWERASAEAARAVREVDHETTVVVGGSSWSHTRGWSSTHPRPWIEQTFAPVRYEAHQYDDADASGTYRESYAAARRAARGAGLPVDCQDPRA